MSHSPHFFSKLIGIAPILEFCASWKIVQHQRNTFKVCLFIYLGKTEFHLPHLKQLQHLSRSDFELLPLLPSSWR